MRFHACRMLRLFTANIVAVVFGFTIAACDDASTAPPTGVQTRATADATKERTDALLSSNLHQLRMAIHPLPGENLPARLENSPRYDSLKELLKHPSTGDPNGIAYVKPDNLNWSELPRNTILFQEMLNGQPAPNGLVVLADGRVVRRDDVSQSESDGLGNTP